MDKDIIDDYIPELDNQLDEYGPFELRDNKVEFIEEETPAKEEETPAKEEETIDKEKEAQAKEEREKYLEYKAWNEGITILYGPRWKRKEEYRPNELIYNTEDNEEKLTEDSPIAIENKNLADIIKGVFSKNKK